MAIQQSLALAHEIAVGMFSHPTGGFETRHVTPAFEVVTTSYGTFGSPAGTSMQCVASPHEAYRRPALL